MKTHYRKVNSFVLKLRLESKNKIILDRDGKGKKKKGV